MSAPDPIVQVVRATRVAVALLTVVLSAGCSGTPVDTPPDVGAAPGVSSTSTAPDPPSGPPESRPTTWVHQLPAGEPPRLGYVLGHTLYEADGTTTHLPRDRGITSITPLGDGWLATDDRTFEGTKGVFRIDPDGRMLGEDTTVAGDPIVSADGTTISWLTFTPPESGLTRPMVVHRADTATGSVETFALPAQPRQLPRLAGVIGTDLYLVDGWEGEITWVIDPVTASRHLPEVGAAVAVSERAGLVAGVTGLADNPPGILLDTATGKALWQRPHTRPVAFSPSGRRLLATSRHSLVVLDSRTGRVERRLGPATGRDRWWLGDYAWEDDLHLLVGARRGEMMAVLRVHVRSGRWERVVEPSPSAGTSEVAFETRH